MIYLTSEGSDHCQSHKRKEKLLSFIKEILIESWIVWCQMAPYLLLGFGIAGALSIWMKPSFIRNHLGKGIFLPVIKTTVLGVPLPLCSCSVLPVAASLHKQGSNKGATAAFLLSTPQTGVDSIAVTYSLMGGFFAFFRAVSAFLSGIIGGIIISFMDRSDAESLQTSPETPVEKSCCSSKNTEKKSFKDGLKHGFEVLPGDIGKPLVIGVLLAGVISTIAPPDFFSHLPGGHTAQLFYMLVLGIPLYVCATSSVPIATALILKGISPGAALVFLIAGPATNAAALSTVWKILGHKTAIIYLLIVSATALGSGYVVDVLLRLNPSLHFNHLHEHGLQIIDYLAGIALIGVLLYAYRSSFIRSAPSKTAKCCSK